MFLCRVCLSCLSVCLSVCLFVADWVFDDTDRQTRQTEVFTRRVSCVARGDERKGREKGRPRTLAFVCEKQRQRPMWSCGHVVMWLRVHRRGDEPLTQLTAQGRLCLGTSLYITLITLIRYLPSIPATRVCPLAFVCLSFCLACAVRKRRDLRGRVCDDH